EARAIRAHALSVLGNRVEAARHIFRSSDGNPFDLINFSFRNPTLIDGMKLARAALPARVARRIEDTRIPFLVNATDFYACKEMIIRSGPLTEAVAASIAIPGIIEAPEIDGRLVIDGAMINPVPFNHVAGKGRITVAIDVTGGPVPRRPGKKPGYTELAFGATQIMQLRITALARQISPPDISISPEISPFRAHDFFKIKDILAAGDAEKDNLKRQIEALMG
ncbi:MAG TPA: patatin-like phospholipase family protein, partial [Rhizobiales bacterium]|nr:patatin-like phospholipase family protein [Hyphomicrobiales bacterium]